MLTLTADELRELTQRTRRDAQVSMLDAAGIPYRVVRGRVIVARATAQAWLEGRTVSSSRAPNMGAIA